MILSAIGSMRKNLKILTPAFIVLVALVSWSCRPSSNSEVPDPAPSIEPTVAEEPALSSIEHPSVLILQDADQSVQLSALTGVLRGKGLQLNAYDRIVGWQDRTQRVFWRMKLIVPGTHQLVSDSTCTGPTREARMRVQVGKNQFVEGLTELSEKPGVLASSALGELTLNAPEVYDVEVEMTGLPLVGEFSLAELRLIPLMTETSPLSKFATEKDAKEKP